MSDLNCGVLAPVADETEVTALAVRGRLPRELDGVLVRNGPNPLGGRFEGEDVLAWWPGAAMLHAVRFANGRALGYRNRWVRTHAWALLHDPRHAGTYADTNPNVNVLRYRGEVLALAEGGVPLAVNADLDTLGHSRQAALAVGMTAHPKVDPETDELVTFRAHWEAPWLRYRVLAGDGTLSVDQEIDVPGPAMMHDMAITATRSVLLDLNVAYDFSLLSRGYRLPLRWHDERAARIGVLPRRGGRVHWFEVAPCFIQHVVNAWDVEPASVVLDVVRYPGYLRLDEATGRFRPNPLGRLWRYRLDLDTGRVHEQPLDERHVELPRINEARTGRGHRYLYAVEQPTDEEMRGLIRYDLHGGPAQRFEVPPGDQNSEGVFVPRPGGTAEDDGWVLVCVYRGADDRTDVVVLDAAALDADPLAVVELPRRIPAGFHGAWLPSC